MSDQDEFEWHPGMFRRGLRHAELTHGEFRVAVEMAEYAMVDKPVVWPSATTLAEICGMTKRGIQGILENLEAKGVIASAGRTKGGRGHTNHWRLVVKRVKDASPFTDPERVIDGSPFEPERVNETAEKGERESAKGGTKPQERVNGGSPEVVREVARSCGEVDARAGEPTDPRGGPPPYRFKPPNGIDPPKRACPKYPHSDACGMCGADNNARKAWIAHGLSERSRLLREMDSLEREKGWATDNDHYMELDRQWKQLRHHRRCWRDALKAEGVPNV